MITDAWFGLAFICSVVFAIGFWRFVLMRNPHRFAPEGANLVAPADGKVIAVIPFDKRGVTLNKGNNRLLGQFHTITDDVSNEGYIVSIFMSPLDVHYNRSPMDGTVTSITHHAGTFITANKIESSLVNEKTELVIKNKDLTIKMIQVAGFLARRIETFVKPQEQVKKGEVVGVIKLGSQVTLVLPRSVNISVKKGDRMVAGETIIATTHS